MVYTFGCIFFSALIQIIWNKTFVSVVHTWHDQVWSGISLSFTEKAFTACAVCCSAWKPSHLQFPKLNLSVPRKVPEVFVHTQRGLTQCWSPHPPCGSAKSGYIQGWLVLPVQPGWEGHRWIHPSMGCCLQGSYLPDLPLPVWILLSLGKKDKTLPTLIDYHGLNGITLIMTSRGRCLRFCGWTSPLPMFFWRQSRHSTLSPSEHNYNVGNQARPTMKLMSEEWRQLVREWSNHSWSGPWCQIEDARLEFCRLLGVFVSFCSQTIGQRVTYNKEMEAALWSITHWIYPVN